MGSLASNLAIATAMVSATVLIHFWGLLLLTRALGGGGARIKAHENHARGAVIILMGVFGIFALHTLEIWTYAALYRLLGKPVRSRRRSISRQPRLRRWASATWCSRRAGG